MEPLDDGAAAEPPPHLSWVADAQARVQVAETRAALLSAAFDEMPYGLMILDADRRLRHANAEAKATLTARDGLALIAARVTPLDARAQDRFARAVRDACHRAQPHGEALRLEREPGQVALRSVVAPLRGMVSGALVLIDPPDAPDAGASRVLAQLYGLTPSEAELAALLRVGLSPTEAAMARGVRLSTVRTQILMLLQKTESRGLANLLRTLARTPRLGRACGGDLLTTGEASTSSA